MHDWLQAHTHTHTHTHLSIARRYSPYIAEDILRLSYFVEGEQQFLLKVRTHGRDLWVEMLQPINEQPGAQSWLGHLRAAGEGQRETVSSAGMWLKITTTEDLREK